MAPVKPAVERATPRMPSIPVENHCRISPLGKDHVRSPEFLRGLQTSAFALRSEDLHILHAASCHLRLRQPVQWVARTEPGLLSLVLFSTSVVPESRSINGQATSPPHSSRERGPPLPLHHCCWREKAKEQRPDKGLIRHPEKTPRQETTTGSCGPDTEPDGF